MRLEFAPASTESRRVRDELHRDVADSESRALDERNSFANEYLAVRTSESRIRRAKPRPDVAEARGREQCVAHSVTHGIAVGVARKPDFIGPIQPAEPQWFARVVRVHVGSDARADLVAHVQFLFCSPHVGGRRDLEGEGVAVDRHHGVTCCRKECGVVRVILGRARVCGVEVRTPKTLRGLHDHESGAVEGLEHRFIRSPLYRVRNRQARDDARPRRPHGRRNAFEDRRRRERSRGVVH